MPKIGFDLGYSENEIPCTSCGGLGHAFEMRPKIVDHGFVKSYKIESTTCLACNGKGCFKWVSKDLLRPMAL